MTAHPFCSDCRESGSKGFRMVKLCPIHAPAETLAALVKRLFRRAYGESDLDAHHYAHDNVSEQQPGDCLICDAQAVMAADDLAEELSVAQAREEYLEHKYRDHHEEE